MQRILIFVLFSTLLYSVEFSDELPIESKQLLDSFECFSKDDKVMSTSYLLALKYRIDNVDTREELVKTELDYWRLWHIESDIEHKCKLYYKFDDILEDTLVQNDEDRKKLKKLRRVEGTIHVDGASESSAKMDKYDSELRKRILLNPPKYTVLPKNSEMNDYNLSTLKNYPKTTIPKNIFDQIEQMKATTLQKDILRREAYLKEEMIRHYDQPFKRKEMKQEILYLEACQREMKLYANEEFDHNHKRKLARKSIMTQYYGLKTEFLPKEIEYYCENNITKMNLSTFIPKVDKKTKTKPKKVIAKLENLNAFLKQYDNNATKMKFAKEYHALMKKLLEEPSRGTPNTESLKLLRLKNCIVGDDGKNDFALIMARVKDFRIEGLKETFYANIFNSQRWWTTTIRMKMEAEGKSKEMKHFFDCSKVYEKGLLGDMGQASPMTPISKKEKEKRKRDRDLKHKIRMAGEQKRELLKYYCGTFDGKSTVDLDNKKAIESGMIPKKFITGNDTITPVLGKRILINGMPKGGIKLTYEGLEKGLMCESLLNFINMDETIYFGNKSYEGLDFVIINGTKIMLDNFSMEYVKELCSSQELNNVSFVMENIVSKHKYNQKKSAVSLYGNTKGKQVPIMMPRFPKVNNTHTESPAFFLVDREAYMISKNTDGFEKSHVHKELNHKSHVVLSRDGNLIATYTLKHIYLYDRVKNRLQKISIPQRYSPQLFLNDNKVLVLFDKKKILFLDLVHGKIISDLQPKFIDLTKKYFTPNLKYITATKNSEELYIMSDKGEVEHWKVKDKGKSLSFDYKGKIETEGKLVSAFYINPYNDEELIYATQNNTINIIDRKNGKVHKVFKADRHMIVKGLDMSRNQKYLMAYDHHFIYLWSLKSGKLIDVIGSKKGALHGAMFSEGNSSRIIRIGENMEVWSIQD
ncbi:hypothetical protein [Sulfurovum sp.]|uniref:hypothetical protein n=1 Tax=Sulfurovum sp. TaxID=1969726 RepID=UPI002867F410|nr:hypothetical protein [Sulfurovum sp.]